MSTVTNFKNLKTSNNITKVYFGGVPTEPDVKKLTEAFPPSGLAPGYEISYKDVEGIINSKKGSSRFAAITSAWRKQLEKNHGIMVGVDPGHAYKILSESEKLLYTQKKHRGVGRAVKRIITVSSTLIDRKGLTEEEKKTKDTLDIAVGKIASVSQIKSHLVLPEM
ncbi:MAG: hypothetical protein WA151_13905 [Desulfatirhabdiaceae bacterium]